LKILPAIALLIVILVGGTSETEAHTRSESYSHWYLSDTSVTGEVTIPLREVMVLYELEDASIPAQQLFQSRVERSTRVFSAGEACRRTGSTPLQVASGFVRVELKFDCGDGQPDEIEYRTMFDVAPAHVHYAKAHSAGMLLGEMLITDAADRWIIGDLVAGDSWSFLSFVRIGIEHIAGGVDHIAFLFGLLLIAGSTGRTVIAITGFTLGHSVSLAAAVLGYISADSQLVEAFIGFTVMLVAVEYFLERRRMIRKYAATAVLFAWSTGFIALTLGYASPTALLAYLGFGIFAGSYLLISCGGSDTDEGRNSLLLLFVATGCFGLVHGFGFAGFLMDTGLLGTSLLVPLLGFNVGVELGQLIIVVAAVLATTLLSRHIPRVMPQLVAASLCGVGVFWFVGRALA